MRKIRLFALATTAAMAITAVCVSATENGALTKVRTDEYLVIDLAKVLDESEEESTEVKEEDDNLVFYMDLMSENTGDYEVKKTFADEPIVAQFLMQNEAFAGYDAAGIYEITGNTTEDLDNYYLSLVLTDNASLYHYSVEDGTLVKTPLDNIFDDNTIPVASTTNHWMVIHLKAEEAENVSVAEASAAEEKASESLEGQIAEETYAEAETTEKPTTKPEDTKTPTTTKVPETTAPMTKAPETTAPTTKAPETTAPTTTAHSHAWVPVTNTVHHDATYKTVWVQDSAAWDETVVTKDAWDENVLVQDAYDEYDEPQLEWCSVCNECGHVFRAGEDVNEHMAAGCWSSWHDEWVQVGTIHHDAVYNTVHHDAETTTVHHEATGHNETVVDQEAWDENVTTGYKCSSCGATK